ncbi:MAG: ABC transporter ATP-binding protein [Rubellimicrobium sp.]|nr:ABC transporter ATP-binding protein [Rubellimicrobium sp.]
MTLLSVENLSVTIHGAPVLSQVALTLNEGEILALTGESGSGKSMTALSIMGLLPQGAEASGRILLDGTDLLTRTEAQLCRLRGRAMGMIFQEPMTALNPVQCIGDQVAETIRLHENAPRGLARARAAEVLARVGLPPDRFPLSRYPHQLSGGQRQRVGLAMAIALRPRLLIADEPTTALDVTTQAQILDLLKGLVADFGMGLLLITHDLAVVANMADRIAVMDKGRIVEAGATRPLLSAPEHPYTRMLFAAARHIPDLPPVRATEPLLQVTNVSRHHRHRPAPFAKQRAIPALTAITFTLHKGERLGLVGESGSGKSTLARAILGLDPVQRGTITLDGAPVFTGTRPNLAVRRRMQIVFQDPFGSFNPRHRVDRLISEPFHLLPDPPRGPARARAITEALGAVNLPPDAARRYIHEFSGGQRQRIAIARALIIRPDLIIFDEAVSALDVSVRARILDLLADLCRTMPLSWLFISHDLSVVRGITDRVLVLRDGRIVEDAPTSRVFAAPQHPYTRSLIDAAPRLPEPEPASA